MTERKRAEETLKRSEKAALRLAQETGVIGEIGRIISSSLDIEKVYERFAEEVRKLIPFDRIVVNLVNPQEGTTTTTYTTGMEIGGRRKGVVFPLAESITEEMIRTGAPVLFHLESIEDVHKRFPGLVLAFQAGLRSRLSVPLIARGEMIGGLALWSKQVKAYGERDSRLAQSVASQIAGAIANAQLFGERNRAAEALKKSEEGSRSIFENAIEGIFLSTPEGRFVSVNPALARIYGWESPLEMVREVATVWSLYVDHEDSVRHGRLLDEHGVVRGFEAEHWRKDGSKFWVLLNTRAVKDSNGKMVCYEGIVQDSTERKKLEDQLRQVQKMEAVGTLAGGVAHDFNNILMALLGYGNLLQRKMEQNDPLRVYVDQILACAGKAVNLTQSLLVFGRKQAMELKPHKVNTTVREVEKLLRRLLPEDIDLLLSLGNDVTVMADMTQIDQVLINLATNARDAMPRGGQLRIETREVDLDRDFKRVHGYGEPGVYALIAVTDTGTGMDEKTREKIFEPFFTTKEVGKGTGLGLSIVYGIVKQHGGYITVYSEQNMGTTFRLYLPAVKAKVLKAKRTPVGVKGGTETILLAEDDPDLRRIVREILGMSGYTVIEATDGHNAVEKFMEHRERLDLLILDVVMPVKNGKEAYEEIKAMKPAVRALFMSGYSSDFILGKGIRNQAVDFLPKPISPNKLLQKVREALDR